MKVQIGGSIPLIPNSRSVGVRARNCPYFAPLLPLPCAHLHGTSDTDQKVGKFESPLAKPLSRASSPSRLADPDGSPAGIGQKDMQRGYDLRAFANGSCDPLRRT